MHIWIILSLIAMFANTAKVLVINRFCAAVDSRVIVFFARLTSALVLLPPLIIVNKAFPLSPTFWIVTIATSLLTAVASILFTHAVKKGPLSTVIPIQACVPVFTLLTLLVTERKTPQLDSTLFMLLSMAAVACTLYQSNKTPNYRSNHTFVFSLYSLIAAALFGVCTFLDKVAVASVLSGALAYSCFWNWTSAIIVCLECLRKKSFKNSKLTQNYKPVLAFSFVSLLAFYTQQYALEKSLSIYGSVVNIKSIVMLHLPLVVLISFFIPGHKPSPKILIAGLIAIIAGIALIRTSL